MKMNHAKFQQQHIPLELAVNRLYREYSSGTLFLERHHTVEHTADCCDVKLNLLPLHEQQEGRNLRTTILKTKAMCTPTEVNVLFVFLQNSGELIF